MGSDFLEFIRSGRLRIAVKEQEQDLYFEQLNRIAKMHGLGEIIRKRSGKHYLKTINGEKEIIIYPAMCNTKVLDAREKICISDRKCRYAVSEEWQKLRQYLY